MIKKLFLSAVFSAVSVFSMAQVQNMTHVVQRGETIESIAEYYHVSVDDINKANPNVDGMVYVGMKLVVPMANTMNITQQNAKVQNDMEMHLPENKMTDDTNIAPKMTQINSHLRFKFFAGVTAGQWTGKDFKEDKVDEREEFYEAKCKTLYGFHVGGNVDYLFTNILYAGIGLVFNQTGYKKEYSMNSGKYWNDEGANYESEKTENMVTNKLDIPIHVGGIFDVTSNTKFFLEAGPFFSYVIGGQKKISGYMTTHEDIHSGETEYYSEKVKIGKDGLKDYQRFGYGVAASVGLAYKNIFLQFSYQRGLSKTIKKTKQYEQNLLLSIGYSF